MLSINEKVSKRRAELLTESLSLALVAFARRQDHIIRCFLPLQGIELKEFLEGFLSAEEKRYIGEQLLIRGYDVTFADIYTPAFKGRSYSTPEKKMTTMYIANCHFEPNFRPLTFSSASGGHQPRKPLYECLSALEWKRQQEQQAFSWLFGTLSERVSSCTSGRELFEFDLCIPLQYDSKLDYSSDARLEQRTKLFRSPIRWANAVTCYRLELRDFDTIRVVYKSPSDVDQAYLLGNAVLFSSLLYVDRIQNMQETDWRRLPRTAFRIIFLMLLGKDVTSPSCPRPEKDDRFLAHRRVATQA